MKTLPPPDRFYFDAAVGWAMLGNAREAEREWEHISPLGRRDPDVLELGWSLYAQAQHWERALCVAQECIALAPDRPFGWIHRAYSLRRMSGGGLQLAWDALRPAAERFPNECLIPYNLACYAAQLNQLETAWDWLQKAMSLGNAQDLTAQALQDPDLAPLRDRLTPG